MLQVFFVIRLIAGPAANSLPPIVDPDPLIPCSNSLLPGSLSAQRWLCFPTSGALFLPLLPAAVSLPTST